MGYVVLAVGRGVLGWGCILVDWWGGNVVFG